MQSQLSLKLDIKYKNALTRKQKKAKAMSRNRSKMFVKSMRLGRV